MKLLEDAKMVTDRSGAKIEAVRAGQEQSFPSGPYRIDSVHAKKTPDYFTGRKIPTGEPRSEEGRRVSSFLLAFVQG